MADVDLSGMTWNTKNPTARTGTVVVVEPRRISRVQVTQGDKASLQQVLKLAEVINENKKIGVEVISIASKSVKTGLGFDQYYEAQKAIAREQGPSGQILAMVKEILARKNQPVAV